VFRSRQGTDGFPQAEPQSAKCFKSPEQGGTSGIIGLFVSIVNNGSPDPRHLGRRSSTPALIHPLVAQ
jgi:hypothetical protein